MFRSHPRLGNTTFLYCIENNMGNEHQWIERFIAETDTMANAVVLQERAGQVGFRTDEAAKVRRPRMLHEKLQMDAVAIVSDVVSVNNDHKRCGEAAVEELLLQMSRVQEFTKMTPTTVKTIITAIFDELGRRIVGQNDDLVQAVYVMVEAMALYYGNKLPTNQYARIKKVREDERGKKHKRRRIMFEGMIQAQRIVDRK